MNPLSSDSPCNPDQTEAALQSGQLPPPAGQTSEFQRQKTVDETLRGLAGLLPPDPGPEITSTWQRALNQASPGGFLTDAGAAAAEALLAGQATGPEQELWQKWQHQHPDPARATQRIDRFLARLPEVTGLTVPPPILENFRQALAGRVSEKPPAPGSKGSGRGWIRCHPWLATASAGAVAALMVCGLFLLSGSLTESPGNPDPAVPQEVTASPPAPPMVTPDPLPTPARHETPQTGPGPLLTLLPVPSVSKTGPPPAPGSMEVLRPVLLAQLTGRAAGETPLPPGVVRSSAGGPVVGTEWKLIFRRAGSAGLTGSQDGFLPALAAALNDPLLADEPYFLVDDHSPNDLDVSLRRATTVCDVLTKLGVPPHRLRPGGKGRFELRPGHGLDGRTSRITVRPASARARGRAD